MPLTHQCNEPLHALVWKYGKPYKEIGLFNTETCVSYLLYIVIYCDMVDYTRLLTSVGLAKARPNQLWLCYHVSEGSGSYLKCLPIV